MALPGINIFVSILLAWMPLVVWLFPAGYLFFNRNLDVPHRGLWFFSLIVTSWLGLMIFLVYLRLDSLARDAASGD